MCLVAYNKLFSKEIRVGSLLSVRSIVGNFQQQQEKKIKFPNCEQRTKAGSLKIRHEKATEKMVGHHLMLCEYNH